MGTPVEPVAFGSGGPGGDIMLLHRSLPVRSSLEEVEAAEALERAADREEQAWLDAIARLHRPPLVPDELFGITLDTHRALASFHCRDQKRDATRLLELDTLHDLFDDLIQRAS
jgi:hypothetical protein